MAMSDSYEEVDIDKLMKDGLVVEGEEEEPVDPDCEGFFEKIAEAATRAVKFIFDAGVSVKLNTAFTLTGMRRYAKKGVVGAAPDTVEAGKKHSLKAESGWMSAAGVECGLSYLVPAVAGAPTKKCRVVVVWKVYPNISYKSANTVAVGFIEPETSIDSVFELINRNEATIKKGKSLSGDGMLEVDVVQYRKNTEVRAASCDNGIVSIVAQLNEMSSEIEVKIGRACVEQE